MSSPLGYMQQSYIDYFNTQPSDVKGQWNTTTEYYKRMLYAKLYSVYDFKIPENWPLNYFRFFLFHCGSIAVIYTKEFGWTCQPYSIAELDLYYQPKVIEVYNQLFSSTKTGIVGVNASIIKIMDDYFGLEQLVSRYAEKLANCDKSIDINLMNTNLSVVAEVENKKESDEIKEAYGEATTGKPLVTINKNVLQGKQLNTLIASPASNFVADKIQQLKRSIVNEFLTEVGIKNANYDKKERLNSAEVEQNNDETKALVEVILDNLQAGFDMTREITAGEINLSVSMRYDYEEGGEADADDTVRDVSMG